ncbi:MAG: glycosyltransferase family 4 protein [Acidobacteria bacterium]|nr:glycosyltransferase family 4 protein [Acidobacteriota bacterium]
MPRIAYLLTAFPTVSETFVEGEFRALLRRGLPIDAYATRNFRESTDPSDPEGDRGLEIQRSPYLLGVEIPRAALHFLLSRPGRTLGALLAILAGNAASPRYLAHAVALFPKSLVFARRMQQRDTRHVHGTWAHYPATVAYTISRVLGITYSFTGHAGLDVLADQTFLAEKVRGARFVLTCHEATHANLERLAPDSSARIHTVHHGVTLSQIPPPGSVPRAQPPEIVSVGRLTPEKGFLDLLQAAALLAKGPVPFRLRIFGMGPQRSALEREKDRLGLRGVAFLEGVAPHSEILQALARATVVTLASYPPPDKNMDGIANVLVEALACGTPVVSTEYEGSRELLEGGHLGSLVPPRNPQRLAEALQSLLSDPLRRAELSRQGRERVERDFDRERNVDSVAALFRQLDLVTRESA